MSVRNEKRGYVALRGFCYVAITGATILKDEVSALMTSGKFSAMSAGDWILLSAALTIGMLNTLRAYLDLSYGRAQEPANGGK